jgi:hypothetical protein
MRQLVIQNDRRGHSAFSQNLRHATRWIRSAAGSAPLLINNDTANEADKHCLLWEVTYAAFVQTLNAPLKLREGEEDRMRQFRKQRAILNIHGYDVCEAANELFAPVWVQELLWESITQEHRTDEVLEGHSFHFVKECIKRVLEVPSAEEVLAAGSFREAQVSF